MEWNETVRTGRDPFDSKKFSNLSPEILVEWIAPLSLIPVSCEPSLIAVIFIFLFLFLCFCFVCSFFIFRPDTGLFLFNLIFENFILHILLTIMDGCSGMFHFPCFIDAQIYHAQVLISSSQPAQNTARLSKAEPWDIQTYSFLEVKLRRLRRKTCEDRYDIRDKNQHTVLSNTDLIKQPGPASQ